MSGFESLLVGVSNWFGFVGSCVAGGGSACRPFLAFVALTAAAGAALTLVVLAYKALRTDQVVSVELTPPVKVEPQVRRSVRVPAERTPASPAAPVSGWQVAA
jgi:hypothetical protein